METEVKTRSQMAKLLSENRKTLMSVVFYKKKPELSIKEVEEIKSKYVEKIMRGAIFEVKGFVDNLISDLNLPGELRLIVGEHDLEFDSTKTYLIFKEYYLDGVNTKERTRKIRPSSIKSITIGKTKFITEKEF